MTRTNIIIGILSKKIGNDIHEDKKFHVHVGLCIKKVSYPPDQALQDLSYLHAFRVPMAISCTVDVKRTKFLYI